MTQADGTPLPDVEGLVERLSFDAFSPDDETVKEAIAALEAQQREIKRLRGENDELRAVDRDHLSATRGMEKRFTDQLAAANQEIERLGNSNAELMEIVDRDTRTIEIANDKLAAANRVKEEAVSLLGKAVIQILDFAHARGFKCEMTIAACQNAEHDQSGHSKEVFRSTPKNLEGDHRTDEELVGNYQTFLTNHKPEDTGK